MAKKSTPKQVIDYDPLAWLDEAAATEAEETPASASKASRNKPTTDKQGRRTEAKTSAAPAQEPVSEESAGYGFFAEEPELSSAQASAQTNAGSVEQEQTETAAYGFFADDASALTGDNATVEATGEKIDLGAELTIRSIAERKTMIDRALATGEDIRIDISQLQKIDSAGVQMIYSLIHSLQQTTQAVCWVGSNPMIDDAAGLLGLAPLLDAQQTADAYGFFADETEPDVEADGAFGFF
ncbi:MAG: STAS domain-containing protein [Gammaproteobacteria bacterium]|nr:STAS domain-containing protein [Gammaproteobacteria bacterium]